MDTDFLTRLAEATNSLRKSDVAGATRAIQIALKISPKLDVEKPANIDLDGGKAVLEATPSHSNQRPPRRDTGRPRRRLGEVVSLLANLEVDPARRLNMLAGKAPKRIVPDSLPPGASFTQHTFSCDAGSRLYKLYSPSAQDQQAKALIIMLHGCTQNPDDFAVGTSMNRLADRHGILVAYPEQASKDNQLKCWNWFNPGDQRRDRGEPSILAGLAKEITAKHNVNPGRVYVAGLSAGGAMAATLADTYPEVFSAVGVHSGLPHAAAYDVPSAFEVMRTGHSSEVYKMPNQESRGSPAPIIIFHGDADGTVHPANGFGIFERACETGKLSLTERRHGEENGRGYKMQAASASDGSVRAELWAVGGGGHAWSGGDSRGTYADPQGPSASKEMLRFFLEHSN